MELEHRVQTQGNEFWFEHEIRWAMRLRWAMRVTVGHEISTGHDKHGMDAPGAGRFKGETARPTSHRNLVAVVLSWRRIIILRSQRLPQWSKLPNDSHPCSHDRRFLPSEAKSLGVPQAWLKQVKLVSRALRNIRHRRAL